MRKKYPNSFKFKVALEALKGNKTITEICQDYGVVSSVVHKWKTHLKTCGMNVFELKDRSKNKIAELENAKLFEQIGRLKVELDYLKKSVED